MEYHLRIPGLIQRNLEAIKHLQRFQKENPSPVEHTNHDLPSTAVDVDQTGVQLGNKLPNTATNLYNLGFLGITMLVVGLILRRKNKA